MLNEQEEYVNTKVNSILYTWGRNEDGELGVPTQKQHQLPVIVRGFKGVVREIGSARTHTGIANKAGELYMAGNLLFGKIGIASLANNFREFKLHT